MSHTYLGRGERGVALSDESEWAGLSGASNMLDMTDMSGDNFKLLGRPGRLMEPKRPALQNTKTFD